MHHPSPYRSTGFTPKGVTLTFFLGHWDMGQNRDGWDADTHPKRQFIETPCSNFLK
jgi:hypothetical protein